MVWARVLLVSSRCRAISPRTKASSSGSANLSRIDHLQITTSCKIALVVDDIGNTAAHARRKVSSGLAEHDNAAARHIFAAMIADTLDDGDRATVPDRETLSGDATDKCFSRSSSI